MKLTREKLNRLEIGKLPPQAVDLEEAVLGALMLDTFAQESVLPILKTEAFYKEAHGHIYQAITNLKSRNEPIDILTVTHELRKMGVLEMVGGPLYISQLTNRVASSANVEAHARIVLEKWMGRSLITLSSEISNDSYEDSSDVFELIDRAEKVLSSVKECSNSGTGKSMSQLVTQLTDEIGKRLEGVNNYIPTGLTDLDRKIHGLVLTDLVIVAARPGMGKTALALTICRSIAKIGTPVGMFSLEMGAVQLTARMISMESGIQYSDLMFGKIEESRLVTYHEHIGRVDPLPIHIDETPGLSIGELRSRARIMVRKLGVKVIVVDYLQKCKSERKGGVREQEINDIASGLKDMAKELKISVIALSQLSRGVESRPNKRPMLSDLRESGSIEQEADQVWFIYRPEYYGEMHDSNGDSTQGMAEINIAKFRNGSPATCKLKFVNHLALFDNLPHQSNMNFPDPDGRIEPQKEDAPF